MRTLVIVLGVLMIGTGLVFIAQGLDLPFAPRSFMTADRAWILIGAVVGLAGAVLIGWARQGGGG
jgi:peptidoglycan/LPS O-acetylase OafA/YrhL